MMDAGRGQISLMLPAAIDAAPVSRQVVAAETTMIPPNSKHWFTTSFLQPLPYLVTPQTTQIKQGVSFIDASKVYTSTNKTRIV